MMDIDLLRSFVSVVDAGGFTKASERVHRTQSTVSQQIKRLEDQLGRPLLQRNGKQATLTEEGERLLSYARRILALEQEARDVVARPMADGVVRLGIPEDFAAYRLAELLSDFVRARPTLRLDVSSGRSVAQKRALSSSSGGQSITAALATAKAALQSTQNVTTMTGSGRVQEAGWTVGTAGSAERMGISFRAATSIAGSVHLEIK